MNDLGPFLWICIGVIVSVILPVLSALIRKKFPRTAAPGVPAWMKRYALLLVFSLVTGVVVLAVYRAGDPTSTIAWYKAFLAGYAWEATIEKIAG